MNTVYAIIEPCRKREETNTCYNSCCVQTNLVLILKQRAMAANRARHNIRKNIRFIIILISYFIA